MLSKTFERNFRECIVLHKNTILLVDIGTHAQVYK